MFFVNFTLLFIQFYSLLHQVTNIGIIEERGRIKIFKFKMKLSFIKKECDIRLVASLVVCVYDNTFEMSIQIEFDCKKQCSCTLLYNGIVTNYSSSLL